MPQPGGENRRIGAGAGSRPCAAAALGGGGRGQRQDAARSGAACGGYFPVAAVGRSGATRRGGRRWVARNGQTGLSGGRSQYFAIELDAANRGAVRSALSDFHRCAGRAHARSGGGGHFVDHGGRRCGQLRTYPPIACDVCERRHAVRAGGLRAGRQDFKQYGVVRDRCGAERSASHRRACRGRSCGIVRCFIEGFGR